MVITTASGVTYGEAVDLESVYPMNFEEQTGGDWYATMLAVSLGGKGIEGASMAGSSEVLMKSNMEFAAKCRVGKIRVINAAKMTPRLKEGTGMVAKTTKKFRGTSKANSFSVVTEDSLWSSNATNRLKSGAFLAASMIAMGTPADKASSVVSDILATKMPYELVAKVSIPLAVLKRDTAVVAKSRAAVFLPQHVIQDVVWEDSQLVSNDTDEGAAIDWARVTCIAKYIGAMNTIACPKFRKVVATHKLPYALVDNHWAIVSREPYTSTAQWKPIPSEVVDAKMFTTPIADKATSAMESWATSAGEIETLHNNPTLGSLVGAMRAISQKKKIQKRTLGVGTDVLRPVTSHSVTPSEAGKLVQGANTSANALRSAMLEVVLRNSKLLAVAAELSLAVKKIYLDDGERINLVKLLADHTMTQSVFLRALEILSNLLGDVTIAQTRMATMKRKLLGNSSAYTDQFTLTAPMLENISPFIIYVAKAAGEGKRGLMLPPKILANPIIAMQAGETMRLLAASNDYLAKATEYWSVRYQSKATLFAISSKEKSVFYGMAASAMKSLKANWLVFPEEDYIPTGSVRESFLYGAVTNYARKRSMKVDYHEPYPMETAKAYAERMDTAYTPEVSFSDAMKFAASKIKMLAQDFVDGLEYAKTEPWVEVTTDTRWAELVTDSEDEEEEPKRMEDYDLGLPKELDLSFMNVSSFKTSFKVTVEECAASWISQKTAEAAALANGYKTFKAAHKDLGEKTIQDEMNNFTKKYFRSLLEEDETDVDTAQTAVI